MMEKPILALIAALVAVHVFTPETPAPQDALAYGMPSLTATTYHVADSMEVSVQTPMGPMDMAMMARATLAMSIETDPAGFRATAEVSDFNGSASNPMMGTQTMGSEAVQGAIVTVVGPQGVVELVDKPDLSQEAGQFSLFEGMAYDLFPRLPGSAVAAGDSWTDTVSWTSTQEGMRTNSTRVRTFTLGEEVEVEGRTLQTIAFSATVKISGEVSQGGATMNQNIDGTETGNYYWDAEAGLLRAAELMRDYKGETTITGAPSVPMTMKGPQRIWREN